MSGEMRGVWMVGSYDLNWITESVHESELEALRVINGRGYGSVHFLPFGADASEAALTDMRPTEDER